MLRGKNVISPSSSLTTVSSSNSNSNDLYPLRTIVVLNFQLEASYRVFELLSNFGEIDTHRFFYEGARTSLGIFVYKDNISALNAVLALRQYKVEGGSLVVHILWEDYEPKPAVGPALDGWNTVLLRNLNRDITHDVLRLKCTPYGLVDHLSIDRQYDNTFATVVFRTSLSAAVATYCLQGSNRRNAEMLLGIGYGTRLLGGPKCKKPLHEYDLPLSKHDVDSIVQRFENYSKLQWSTVFEMSEFPLKCSIYPNFPRYLHFRVARPKDMSIYLEILTLRNNIPEQRRSEKLGEYFNNSIFQNIYRLFLDFRIINPFKSGQLLHGIGEWNAFFVLDLELCYAAGKCHVAEEDYLHLSAKIQGMNNVHSDIVKTSETESVSSLWFGEAKLKGVSDLTELNSVSHDMKIYDIQKFSSIICIVCSMEGLNQFQIPVHVSYGI